jgi:imidazolonepropionase-like amidohydrolase
MAALDLFADDEASCRRVVRNRVRDGADVIKLGLSSGHFGDIDTAWGDDPDDTRLNHTITEARIMVEEAHRAERKVSAHAIGDAAVQMALDVGVDVIEHGHGISDRTRSRLAESQTIVVSTLSAQQLKVERGLELGLTQAQVDVAAVHYRHQIDDMKRALDVGVRVALGSDMIGPPIWPHGENAHEYVLAARDVGQSAREVLHHGLSLGAEVLGLTGQIGSLEPGASADIIGVLGDPTVDVGVLREPVFVMSRGRVVKNDLPAPSSD